MTWASMEFLRQFSAYTVRLSFHEGPTGDIWSIIFLFLFSSFPYWFLETRSNHVALAGLDRVGHKLRSAASAPPPECWDWRCALSLPTLFGLRFKGSVKVIPLRSLFPSLIKRLLNHNFALWVERRENKPGQKQIWSQLPCKPPAIGRARKRDQLPHAGLCPRLPAPLSIMFTLSHPTESILP